MLPAALVALVFAAPAVRGQLANFENFAEGSRGASFTDPVSGILFRNAFQFTTTPTTFSTDFSWAIAGRPKTSPGVSLVGAGFTAGNGFTYSYGMSFTMEMPRDISAISFDLAQYGAGNTSYRLDLFNAAGTQLYTLPAGSFGVPKETSIRAERPTADIRSARVNLASNPSLYAAYDNITIPEPTTTGVILPLVVGAVGAIDIRRR